MPSNVVKIDESEATLVSFSDLGAEEALVTAAKRGDGRAFEMLVKRHEPGILALALRYTRVREDAEDVVQKSFQKAFVHLHRFEGKSRFSTWLSRIAINEALMLLRKKRASPEVPIEESTTMEETSLALDLPDSDPSPEENCLHEERKRILSAAIKQLTPRKRKAIELRELGEFSTTETARILGLSISAVKARVFHARKALRTSLKDTSGLFGRPGETLKEPTGRRGMSPKKQLPCKACA